MHQRRTVYFIAMCAVALSFVHAGWLHGASKTLTQNANPWISLAPADEEFTAKVPASPTMRIYPVSNNQYDKREKVLAHREYSGYGDGLVFIIHSYKAAHPEKLGGDILNLINEGEVFQRLQFDDVTAELFRGQITQRDATYTRHTLRFIIGKHLYVMALMTLTETNPAVEQFLSSLAQRKPSDAIARIDPPVETSSSPAFSANEVTRRVIVVWKSEPWYTDEARAHRVVGRVTLNAVFDENGYVTNITVIKGLKDGLTESAIDAARNIRFFPAEKDGRRVSQRTMLEFGFNLY